MPDILLTTWNQADTGRIPVSGAGYRGRFHGPGFDSIWTDMSEIVRPTRDGIHGREYISTSVDRAQGCPEFRARRLDAHPALAPAGNSASGILDIRPGRRRARAWPPRIGAAKELRTLAVGPLGDAVQARPSSCRPSSVLSKEDIANSQDITRP